ncbi:MAG: hypothetical protein F6K40_03575 [Okeania sp. SIO3I5]|nr:hypothetical protein [Okeania sp. SIO3I5]NEQ35432.1 hypothetical protein [Okeania sp. SIO3I5]
MLALPQDFPVSLSIVKEVAAIAPPKLPNIGSIITGWGVEILAFASPT